MRLLLVALAISAFLALAQLEGSVPEGHLVASTFALRADTTCPALRLEAEGVLKRFLTHPDFVDRLDAYDHTGVDTSEVEVVVDPVACAALDSTIAQAYSNSTLNFRLAMLDKSYLATDSFYYAVELPRRPDPHPGYVYVAMGSIIVIGKDYSFKRGFNF